MPQLIKRKKFKSQEVEEYMKGKYFSQWEGIKNAAEARQNLKLTANANDKKDFSRFSGLLLEKIVGTKNYSKNIIRKKLS